MVIAPMNPGMSSPATDSALVALSMATTFPFRLYSFCCAGAGGWAVVCAGCDAARGACAAPCDAGGDEHAINDRARLATPADRIAVRHTFFISPPSIVRTSPAPRTGRLSDR